MNSLLDDITSGDSHRIWSSSCAIARLRDPQVLEALAASLPQIKSSTESVELGGAMVPNQLHLTVAIHRLEYVRDREGCLCRLYPEYPFYNPKNEATDGNVTILETVMQGVWTLSYSCQCTVCEARYTVEEGESHYMWWAWKPD